MNGICWEAVCFWGAPSRRGATANGNSRFVAKQRHMMKQGAGATQPQERPRSRRHPSKALWRDTRSCAPTNTTWSSRGAFCMNFADVIDNKASGQAHRDSHRWVGLNGMCGLGMKAGRLVLVATLTVACVVKESGIEPIDEAAPTSCTHAYTHKHHIEERNAP